MFSLVFYMLLLIFYIVLFSYNHLLLLCPILSYSTLFVKYYKLTKSLQNDVVGVSLYNRLGSTFLRKWYYYRLYSRHERYIFEAKLYHAYLAYIQYIQIGMVKASIGNIPIQEARHYILLLYFDISA